MAAPQGLFAYPGILGVMSGSITIGHGVTPSLCRIRAPMQTGPFPKVGTLTISYGAKTIYLPNCQLGEFTVDTTPAGFQVLDFPIKDRRWRWNYGRIRGRYNVREGAEKTLKLRWEMEPKKLAKLCFEAMGEKKYDVDRIPNDARPEIDWDCLPSEALTRLCESLGCHVIYDPLTDKARIVRIGQGSMLPLGDVISDTLTVDPPELPDEFRLICGPTQYQFDLELEPVAEEVEGDKTGEIVPVNKVSYRPTGGWEQENPAEWANVIQKHREHAKQEIYRHWRPKVPIKQYKLKIEALDLIQLYDHGVEPKSINSQSSEVIPAMLGGEFWDGEPTLDPALVNLKTAFGPVARFNRGFSIDTARSLIRTSEPLFRLVDKSGQNIDIEKPADLAESEIRPAILYLRCAVSVRDKETHAFLCREIVQETTGPKLKTEPHYIQRPDLWESHWITSSTGSVVEKDNIPNLDQNAKQYLLEEIARWQLLQPGTRVYAGLVPFSPDGAISEVTYTVEESGHCKTVLSRNTERPEHGLTYDEKREIAWLRQNLTNAKQSGVVNPLQPAPRVARGQA